MPGYPYFLHYINTLRSQNQKQLKNISSLKPLAAMLSRYFSILHIPIIKSKAAACTSL